MSLNMFYILIILGVFVILFSKVLKFENKTNSMIRLINKDNRINFLAYLYIFILIIYLSFSFYTLFTNDFTLQTIGLKFLEYNDNINKFLIFFMIFLLIIRILSQVIIISDILLSKNSLKSLDNEKYSFFNLFIRYFIFLLEIIFIVFFNYVLLYFVLITYFDLGYVMNFLVIFLFNLLILRTFNFESIYNMFSSILYYFTLLICFDTLNFTLLSYFLLFILSILLYNKDYKHSF